MIETYAADPKGQFHLDGVPVWWVAMPDYSTARPVTVHDSHWMQLGGLWVAAENEEKAIQLAQRWVAETPDEGYGVVTEATFQSE